MLLSDGMAELAVLAALVAAVPGVRAGADEFTGTGADSCVGAQIVAVPIGPPGAPEEVLIHGSNLPASGPDCALLAPDPLWWEAFSIDQCSTVHIDLCETTPVRRPSYAIVFSQCPCAGQVARTAAGRGAPVCESDNIWMRFDGLPAGVYFYPVYSDSTFVTRGDYTIRVRAEACTGACCDPKAGTCVDGTTQVQCDDMKGSFSAGLTCCRAECRAAGAEFDAENVELLTHVGFDRFVPTPHESADVWGYVSPSGREYAIIGFSTGTGIVEVTRPTEPVVIEFIPSGGVDIIWREMKTFHEYLYVISDGIGIGMQIIDLSRVDEGIATLANTTTLTGDFYTAHNIAINEESGFAYLVLANAPVRGITALDLADPLNPVIAGTWDEAEVHDLQVVTYHPQSPSRREIAFAYAGGDGLFIVDVTDKLNMTTVSGLLYPTVGYCHQGWLRDDRRYIFVDDEFDELFKAVDSTTTYVIDVQDLADPRLLTTFTNGLCTIDHNLMTRRNYVYEANYTSGLRVFDAGDLGNVREVGYFDTHPESNDQVFEGAWGVFAAFPSGVVLVSDIERGLFVLSYDCDDNGRADVEQLAEDASLDCNANRFLDDCEYLVSGDLNRDRTVNRLDQQGFNDCHAAPCATAVSCGTASYSKPCCRHVDFDADGDVDLLDAARFVNGAGPR